MARKKKLIEKPTLDPKLVRQLDESPDDSDVEAVFTLKTPAGEAYRAADSTREAVSKIIEEAASQAKSSPRRLNVFPNLQSFTISGPPSLVRSVMGHKEIASAMANQQSEEMLIRPVRKEPAEIKPTKRRGASRKTSMKNPKKNPKKKSK